MQTLSPKDREKTEKALQEINHALYETRSLIKKLQQYDRLAVKLNQTIDQCMDLCYNPEKQSGALQSAGELKRIFSAFTHLQEYANKSNQTDLSGQRVQLLCQDEERALEWMVEEWSDNLQESVNKEFNELKTALSLVKDEDREPLLRQLKALHTQLKWSAQQLSSNKGKDPLTSPFTELRAHIVEARKSCLQKQDEVLALLNKYGAPKLAPLEYGSQEWQELAKARPQREKGWAEKTAGKLVEYIEPSYWSDETKRAVNNAFTAMQLTAGAFQFVNSMNRPTKEQADALQKKVLDSLSKEDKGRIDKEAAKLGTILSDKFEALKDPEYIARVARGNNTLQEALQQAATLSSAPSPEQVSNFCDAYRLKSQLAVAPNPFHHLSFSEWWNLFTTSETIPELPKTAPFAVAVRQGDAVTGVVPTLLQHVGSFFNRFAMPADAPAAPTFIQNTTVQGYTALKEARNQLQTLQNEASRFPASVVDELRGEIALLHRSLMQSVTETPDETCPVLKLAEWFQTVEDKCYAVKDLETRIAALMNEARSTLTVSDEKLRKLGKKHANNVQQHRLVETLQIRGVKVPVSHGAPSDAVRAFLEKEAPDIFTHWQQLGQLFANYTDTEPFLKLPKAQQHLSAIQDGIAQAFEKVSQDPNGFSLLGLPETMPHWLAELKQQKRYLMVRSTGAEDSRATANAGGNVSVAYVDPEAGALCRALGEVVQSYFGYSSLQNRLNAKLNPFEEDLQLAVTTQELIGEPVGGAKNPQDIPVSLVLFTNEPLYIGDEKFRVMRLSASYGHGEAVVGNKGVATDTALLLISEAHPDKLYMLYDNQHKPTRLAPVSTSEGIKLEKLPNPPELQNRPALDEALLKRLYVWGVVGEKFFGDKPTDMEIVIKDGIIHPVQARPVNRQPLLPTYLDLRKISALKESPIRAQMTGEMIVPGKASVVLCTKPEEVLYAATLEEAEKHYTEGSDVKLVVVSQEEPANSHPVVNFSASAHALPFHLRWRRGAKDDCRHLPRTTTRRLYASRHLADTRCQSRASRKPDL